MAETMIGRRVRYTHRRGTADELVTEGVVIDEHHATLTNVWTGEIQAALTFVLRCDDGRAVMTAAMAIPSVEDFAMPRGRIATPISPDMMDEMMAYLVTHGQQDTARQFHVHQSRLIDACQTAHPARYAAIMAMHEQQRGRGGARRLAERGEGPSRRRGTPIPTAIVDDVMVYLVTHTTVETARHFGGDRHRLMAACRAAYPAQYADIMAHHLRLGQGGALNPETRAARARPTLTPPKPPKPRTPPKPKPPRIHRAPAMMHLMGMAQENKENPHLVRLRAELLARCPVRTKGEMSDEEVAAIEARVHGYRAAHAGLGAWPLMTANVGE